MTVFGGIRLLAVASLLLAIAHKPILGQISPDEHASHHPAASSQDQTGQPAQTSAPASTTPPVSAGGMMMSPAEMAKMMQPGCCGAGSNNPLFPTLMALPPLSTTERAKVEQTAHQRMTDGADELNRGLDQLATATAVNDYAAMQLASAHMREGMDAFQSGLAAHRSLAENQNPQVVALQWFRQQLNLPDQSGSQSAFSPFHWFIMAALVAFAAVMIWMYFHKMRRADALIAGLASGKTESLQTGQAAPIVSLTAAPSSIASTVATSTAPRSDAPIPSKSNSWTGKLRVMRIFQETPNVKTFRFGNPSGDPLPFVYLPGQFLTVTVTPKGYRTKRSYTIASSPTQLEYCEATVKHEEHGIVSSFLNDQVHEGDLLEITAPSGKFTFTGKEAGSVVFIAAGVGVTPFMAAIRYLTDRCWTGDIYLIYQCHAPENIIFREDFEYIQRRFGNVHVTFVVSDPGGAGWRGKTGHVTKELLKEVVPAIATRHVHICGPNAFMADVKGMLAEAGVPADEIMTEVFVGKETPAKGAEVATIPIAAPGPPVGDKTVQTKTAPTVTFAKSNKVAPLSPDRSILEISEDIGVNIDYSCRVGTCGVCKIKLLSGNVTMEVQDALDPDDKAQNIILACQAKSTADVSVEA